MNGHDHDHDHVRVRARRRSRTNRVHETNSHRQTVSAARANVHASPTRVNANVKRANVNASETAPATSWMRLFVLPARSGSDAVAVFLVGHGNGCARMPASQKWRHGYVLLSLLAQSANVRVSRRGCAHGSGNARPATYLSARFSIHVKKTTYVMVMPAHGEHTEQINS